MPTSQKASTLLIVSEGLTFWGNSILFSRQIDCFLFASFSILLKYQNTTSHSSSLIDSIVEAENEIVTIILNTSFSSVFSRVLQFVVSWSTSDKFKGQFYA